MPSFVQHSMPKWLFVVLVVAVAGLAQFLRTHELGLRPMHGDEANQAVKAGILLETGEYKYDPHDHHGPTLYYIALLPMWASGVTSLADMSEPLLRLVPAFFGVATVLILLLVGSGLGRWGAVWAGLLIALSPASVFYSRYFIQEVSLVFFTFVLIIAGYGYSRAPRWGWAVLAGVAAGLMHATKETCVLAFAAMAGGIVLTIAWNRFRDGRVFHWRPAVNWKHVGIALAAAVVLSVTLFSSFYSHWRGPLDSLLTYGNYLQRADGAGMHDKPWYYYLSLLIYTDKGMGPTWSEGLIVGLFVVGGIAALARKSPGSETLDLPRFLTFYTLLLVIIYSIIPYKTPWSMLSFHHGMTLVGGFGAVSLIRAMKFRPLQAFAAALLLAGLYHLGAQAWRASFDYPADPRNPYVYAHTSSAFMRLDERMHDLTEVHPDGKAMPVAVVVPSGDYWPLPWYLRDMTGVGYYDSLDAVPEGAVVIVSSRLQDLAAAKFGTGYRFEFHGLRPGVLLNLWIPEELWERFMESRR